MNIIINETVALGDGIKTFPVMIGLCRKLSGINTPFGIYWRNKELGDLFPQKYGFRVLSLDETCMGIPWSQAHPYYVSYHWHTMGKAGTDTSKDFGAAYANLYGLDLSNITLELNIPDDFTVPSYDFVIAPQVLNNPQKNPSPSWWQTLVDAIRRDYSFLSICVMGKSSLPKDEDLAEIEPHIKKFHEPNYLLANTTKYLKDVDYFWDEPLVRVAKLIDNTRVLFINTDSGPYWMNTIIKVPMMTVFGPPVPGIFTTFTKADKEVRTPHHPTVEEAMQRIHEVLK